MKNKQNDLLIGVISDTHGHVQTQVLKLFKKVDFIIHAGDIDTQNAFETLNNISPVVAVRGNMDQGQWADIFPKTDIIETGKTLIYAIHNIQQIDLDPAAAGINAVIYGHSHIPTIEKQNGTLFFNPGSATLPKHSLRASVGLLKISGKELNARIIDLQ